jgi:exopolysaccharide production protein ExoQ
MRRIIDYLAFLMLLLSSGAIIQLIMDGGARNQELDAIVTYSGPLNYLPVFWKIAVVTIVGIVLLIPKRRYFSFDFIWLALLALSFVSALWAEYPKVSFDSALLMLLAYLLVNLQVELCGWRRVLNFLNKVFIFVLLLSVAGVFLLPSYGVSVGDHVGKWQGVFVHKNTLGSFAAMTYLFFLWCLSINRSKWAIAGIILSVLLVIGSESTTGLMNITLSTILFALLRFSFTRKLVFSWRYLIAVLLALGCVYLLYLSLTTNPFAIGDKDSSFSNRNLIWAYILLKFQDAPWFGHGLGQIGAAVLSNDAEFISHVGFVVGTAHNGFIECLHALGLVGLTIIVIVLFRPLRFKSDGPDFEFYFLYLLFFVLLNMFVSNLLGFNIFFIMLMYVQQLAKAMSTQRNAQVLASPNTLRKF